MYFKNLYLLLILLSFAQATVYESGENNSTKNWTVYDKDRLYDNNESTKLIENVYDKEKKSHVINFKGENLSYTYLIGDINGSNAWNNTDESIFSWSMKIDKPYQIILFTNTKKGIRYIFFSHNKTPIILNNQQYIHIPLNLPTKENRWESYSFDIASKIKNEERDNQLISINGLSIQATGRISNIQLSSNHNDFIITMRVNRDNNLTIETDDRYKYDFNIHWGDGSVNRDVKQSISHHYEEGGEYTININGIFPHIYQLCSNNQTLLSIEQWGGQKWKSMKEAFINCHEFTTIHTQQAPDLSEVKSMYRMFYNNYNFDADLSSWDVSHIKDMSAMFYHAEKFNHNIGEWNISSVQDTSFMFNYALKFNQDISRWDVSSVKDMQLMFRSAQMFDQNISQWDISSVKKIYNMFKDAKSFNQNLDQWDTSAVRDSAHLKYKKSPPLKATPLE
jgi:hypothetical protein